MRTSTFLGAAALATLAVANSASAAPNLVQNGSFESSSYTSNTQFGPHFGGQGVTDWTGGGAGGPNQALEFYFFGGTQTTVSAKNEYNDPKGYFYSSFSSLSPDGGNFVALDGDPNVEGSISQTVGGLITGKSYTLKFYYAATQFANRTGDTTEQLKIGFGGDTKFTPVISNPSTGFTPTGWATWQDTFTASGTSELLSFLSIGTPAGLPPVMVLDGISLTRNPDVVVPEPAALALLGLGLAGIGAARLRRR